MSHEDIRWQQRLSNFDKALLQLSQGVELSRQRALSDLEKQGLILAFEFTHELAWQVLRDFFAYQGNPSIMGSRDASREAFQRGLIDNGEGWMEMIKSRNMTSHTYNQATANEIVEKVCTLYIGLFTELQAKLHSLKRADA